MTPWLDSTVERLARALGAEPEALRISDDDAALLLDLAAFAARDSGERTNAPLLCHVLGMLRAAGAPLGALAVALRGEEPG
jgi:hypothetical protein